MATSQPTESPERETGERFTVYLNDNGYYQVSRPNYRGGVVVSAESHDAVTAALRAFLIAPSGKQICACENNNAVKAGMASLCAYCVARAALGETQ